MNTKLLPLIFALTTGLLFTTVGGAGAQLLQPGYVDDFVGKPRVVVLSDMGNEPDDQMSFVRLLLYSNELDLEALIATTSTWQKNKVQPDTMRKLIAAYGEARSNLLKHASGWPEAANPTTVTNEWLETNVRAKGPLGKLYPKFAFIMEADTPSFLGLTNNGLNSYRNPSWGGWGGRYVYRQPYGEPRPIWTQGGDLFRRVTSQDAVIGADGKTSALPVKNLLPGPRGGSAFRARSRATKKNYSACRFPPASFDVQIEQGISGSIPSGIPAPKLTKP